MCNHCSNDPRDELAQGLRALEGLRDLFCEAAANGNTKCLAAMASQSLSPWLKPACKSQAKGCRTTFPANTLSPPCKVSAALHWGAA